jgi:hypothetical protein
VEITVLIYGLAAAVAALALVVRRRVVGRLPRPGFWVAAAIGIVATVVGTTVRISGVLLAVVAAVPMAWAVLTDRWRIGDTGLLLTMLGFGMGAAYLLAAVLDPATGSYADQGALAIAILGSLVSLVAIAWSLARARPH